jgi:hypothetical protein
MPLQFEGCWEFVNAFVQQLHHTIIAAIERDFADPDRSPRFNSHDGVVSDDPGSPHPSETFAHALENPRPIVAPLILIIVANKIGHSFPVSVFDRVKEVFCVQPDLMRRSPKPDKVQPNANGKCRPANQCSTNCNRHTVSPVMLSAAKHLLLLAGDRIEETIRDSSLRSE